LRGRVTAFDERRGVGEIASEDGRSFAFHATAIANGSRKVAENVPVEFDVEPGLPGRWEAFRIKSCA
jgi:cold shock CspA family protein